MAKITELELKAFRPEDAGKWFTDEPSVIGKVRINRAGKVIVYFEYRYKSPSEQCKGKNRAITLGTWPADRLVDIRKKRAAYRVALDQGRDPLADKQAGQMAAKADQAEAKANAQARLDAIAAASKRMTVSELFDLWERMSFFIARTRVKK